MALDLGNLQPTRYLHYPKPWTKLDKSTHTIYPIREKLDEAMSELGIPPKLIRLCRMTLNNTSSSSVMVEKDLSEPFDTRRGLRQGDNLSAVLFNILIVRKAAVNMQ